MLLRRTPFVRDEVDLRISQDHRPPGKEPALVVSRVSGGFDKLLNGRANWSRPMFQVTCYAPRATEANKLRDYVRRSLQGFSGNVGQTQFGSVILDDEDHRYIPGIEADDTGTYARALVFQCVIVPRADITGFPEWFTLSLMNWSEMTLDGWNNFLI